MNVEPFKQILNTITQQSTNLNKQLTNNSCKKVFNLFTNNNENAHRQLRTLLKNNNGNVKNSIEATKGNTTELNNTGNIIATSVTTTKTNGNGESTGTKKSAVENLRNIVKKYKKNNNSSNNTKKQYKSKFMELLKSAMKEVAQNKENEQKILQEKKQLIITLMTDMKLGTNKNKNKINNIQTNNGLINFLNKLILPLPLPLPPPTQQQEQNPMPPSPQQEQNPMPPTPLPLRQNQIKKDILINIKNILPNEYTNNNALQLLELISKKHKNLTKTNFTKLAPNLYKNKNPQLTPTQIGSLYNIKQEYWRKVLNKFKKK